MNSSTKKSNPNPQESANLISKFFYWWTNGIYKKGYRSVFLLKDLYDPLNADRATVLGDRLEKKWNVRLKAKERKGKKPPNLWMVLFLAFKKEFLWTGVHHAFEMFLSVIVPLVLGLLLTCFIADSTSTVPQALTYAAILMIADLIKSVMANHKLFDLVHLGGRMRIAVTALIYRKSLKLSKTALNEITPGRIVNLCANDVNRFDFVMYYSHYIWSTPITVVIIAYILYLKGSYPALIGLAVLLVIVPVQVYTANLSKKYRRKAVLKTDERVQLLEQIVSGVQLIKMYAWEKPFCTLVQTARRLELRIMGKSSYLRDLCLTCYLFTPRVAFYFAALSMFEFGHHLTYEKVFVLLPFYYFLAETVGLSLKGLVNFAECSVSVRRIRSFLLLDEYSEAKSYTKIEDTFKTLKNEFSENNDTADYPQFTDVSKEIWSVTLENFTGKWNLNSPENTLEKINLKLERGKLYCVIGMTGSGKSSLLSTILREINVLDGQVKINGSLSYASQDAWVFANTVRQNILFGETFVQQRYQRTIDACCLLPDFEQFPEDDFTVVGEKGVSLSGGQKARINLARAVYRDADVYLLDDPLSAVDARVGKRLFHKCILGFLKDKTRILATHQIQYIKHVDGIILLNQGRAQFYTDYQQFLDDYPEYQSLMVVREKDETNAKIEIIRQISVQDYSSIKENNDDERQLEDIMEKSSKTSTKGGLLLKYFRSGSNLFLICIMCLLFIITQVCVCLNDLFVLTYTTAEENYYGDNSLVNISNLNMTKHTQHKDLHSTEIYIYIYTGIILAVIVFGTIRALVFSELTLRTSRSLHNSTFEALISTSLRFFHMNPSGRILNRLSQDVSIVDELLPANAIESAQMLLASLGAMIVACSVNTIFYIPSVIIIILWYCIRIVFVKTSNNIRCLEGITRAPVLTHLNQTLNGVATIRVCQAETILKQEFEKFQDIHTSSWYNIVSCRFAYGLMIKLLSYILLLFVTFGFAIYKNDFREGHVGLAVTQLFTVPAFLAFGSIISAEAAHQLMGVERLLEYARLPKESEPEDTGTDKKDPTNSSMTLILPPKTWPHDGLVEFKHVSMRYSEDEDPVLKNLNFVIKPTEKIGIVGRTGAGKSSLIGALFRLADLEGIIAIDGIDTGSIGLGTLRSRIAIIPQDPVLFTGTLRRNLDPFNEFSDNDLWDALEQVELKSIIATANNGLDSQVLDKGSNFSVGQRQLVCLARAVLRKNRVLVSDEATANVDPQTDAMIQRTIRTKFDKSTVLTVAHRLNTIIDSDRVMVMDNGCLVEFDHPYNLLRKENSRFASLVKETGDTMFHLFETAERCYKEKFDTNM